MPCREPVDHVLDKFEMLELCLHFAGRVQSVFAHKAILSRSAPGSSSISLMSFRFLVIL